MLILKAFVNEKQIDEIKIHNIGVEENGVAQYEIRKPENLRNIRIFHIRENGWKILAEKALYAINATNRAREREETTRRKNG